MESFNFLLSPVPSASTHETCSPHNSLRGFLQNLSTFIQHQEVWMCAVNWHSDYFVLKTSALPSGTRSLPAIQLRIYSIYFLFLVKQRGIGLKQAVPVHSERLCFSSSKHALGTKSPGFLQLHEGACKVPVKVLAGQTLASHPCRWAVFILVLSKLLVPLCLEPFTCNSRLQGIWQGSWLNEAKISTPSYVVGQSGNVHPKGSGSTRERGMLHNRIPPSLEVCDSGLCSCVISAVDKGGGCLESQCSEE